MTFRSLQQWILALVVAVVGGIGNGLLLFVHLKRKPPLQGKMKVAMHFIVTMAAVDFAVCAVILPIEITTFATQYRNYPNFACKIFGFGRLTGLYASNFLLIGIAVDRFISVCFPFKVGINYFKAKIITFICVAGGMLVASPNLYFFEVFESPDMKMKRCQMKESPDIVFLLRLNAIVLLAIYIVSVVIIVVLYLSVWVVVSKKERRRAELKRPTIRSSVGRAGSTPEQDETMKLTPSPAIHAPNTPTSAKPTPTANGRDKEKEKNDKDKNNASSRTAFMLSLVTLVFVFTWLPYWIINCIAMTNYFHSASPSTITVALFFSSFYYINNASNPIIYTFASSSFRKDIKEQLLCSGQTPSRSHSVVKSRHEHA